MTDVKALADIAAWNTRATPSPEAGLADELHEVVKPVIGACLLMRPDDPRLAHPRLGVAVEVANAVVKHLALRAPTPADRAEKAEALLRGTLEAAQTDLDLLRMAVEADDPKAEILIRITDIWRRIDTHLAGAVAEGEA